MSSYRQILYHIVFRTKESREVLSPEYIREFFGYTMGIIHNKQCKLYRINAMEDHVHILSDLHPGVALADLVRDIKTASSIWLRQSGKFPKFAGWADGYAAFTYAYRDKDLIVNYIKNQQEHHKRVTFADELKQLLAEHGVEYDEKYFP